MSAFGNLKLKQIEAILLNQRLFVVQRKTPGSLLECGGGAYPFPIHFGLSNYSRMVGLGGGGGIATMGVYSISWINGIPQKSGFMVF